MAGFAAGTPKGIAAWLVLSCRAMRTGAQEALAIAETLTEQGDRGPQN
jgi:hypothetical protein